MSDAVAADGVRLVRMPGWMGIAPLGALVVSVALVGCSDRGPGPSRGAATARMAERLREIARDSEPQRHPYVTSARLDSARRVEPPPDVRGRLVFRASLARAAVQAGRMEEGIEELEKLVGDIRSHPMEAPSNLLPAALDLLGVAHLQLWERQNCVDDRRNDLCRFPIESDGRPAGRPPRRAVEAFTQLLGAEPGNLTYRWLLNLAHMMAGDYPDGVPRRWLIPPQAFRPEYDLPRFPDVAPALDLDVRGHAGGAIVDDFDGDGNLDIVASSWHLTDPIRYFRNNGDGTFSDRSSEAGLDDVVGGLNLVQADYDNDGDLDILVLRGAWTPYGEPNSLLRNDGEGRFQDVTESAGLLSTSPTQTAAWGDYDNDGRVDLYIGNESSASANRPNQLFHNNGDGTFTDVAREAGVAVQGFVKGVVWGDIDNDGRLDLYISRLRQPNLLLRNDGPDANGRWRFSDVTVSAGVAEPVPSFPTWFWDYDNDGWLDIFVAGYAAEPGDMAAEYLRAAYGAERPRLYRNERNGRFRDVTADVHLDRILFAMGSNYGDLDNDGWPDLYVGTGDSRLQMLVPSRMFRNADGRSFQEVTTAGGFGYLAKGHGVAFGDLDNDGDQDVYVTLGGAYEGDEARNVLLENPGNENRWITLRLEGVRSNRAAIGARLTIHVRTPSGRRLIHAVVTSGGSFGASSLQQEVGLGRATAVTAIDVRWPAGESDTLPGVEMDRVYRIREGDLSAVPVATRAFHLAPGRGMRNR